MQQFLCFALPAGLAPGFLPATRKDGQMVNTFASSQITAFSFSSTDKLPDTNNSNRYPGRFYPEREENRYNDVKLQYM
jgi:hypothetical protein